MEFKKDYFADERRDDFREVGVVRQRADALGHVTGRTQFYADRRFAGMLHMRMVRSPHHHARIRSINTAEAERVPGVVRIIRAADVPKNIYTILQLLDFGVLDEPVLAFDKVRYAGEPIVAVLGTSMGAAYQGAAKVQVDYEPLPAVFDVEEALRPGAPLVNEYHGQNYFDYNGYDHQKVRLGDVERGFQEADHVIEERYQMSPIEHAPTETGGCIAVPDTDGRYTCYTNTQALFFSMENVALILDVPVNKLHFVGGTVGGGFGGKNDTVVEPIAILGAMLTQRPVRYFFNRAEEMQVSSPRGAERFYIKDGVMNDGRIVARRARMYFDAGGYSRLSPYGAVKCAAHMPGPYTIPNVSIDAHCVYTNRTPSSSMRGFGVTGADFALEVQMDKLARLLGMDPMEFRILNAYRDGDMKAHHRRTSGAALVECVQAAAELANWPLGDRFKAMSSRQGGGSRG
jgi:CO/xanthine dehydrogenase Mo-binding subunit